MDVGPPELLIILLVVLVLFGGAKLPKLARSIGQASSEFKAGMRDGATNTKPDATTTDGTARSSAESDSA